MKWKKVRICINLKKTYLSGKVLESSFVPLPSLTNSPLPLKQARLKKGWFMLSSTLHFIFSSSANIVVSSYGHCIYSLQSAC